MSDEPGKISFEFVTDPMIRSVLSDYFAQASKALVAESYLGAVVGFGAVVEGLLIWALQQRDAQARATTAARNYRAEPIERWKLEDLIDVSKELGVIDEPEHAVRDWRNLVHPYRRIRGSPRFDHALAPSTLR